MIDVPSSEILNMQRVWFCQKGCEGCSTRNMCNFMASIGEAKEVDGKCGDAWEPYGENIRQLEGTAET